MTDKYTKKLEEKIKGYSPETLYSLGKNSLNDLRYVEAEMIFDELKKRPSEFKSTAGLYGDITSVLITSELERKLNQLNKNFSNAREEIFDNYASERIVEQTIICMNNSLVRYVNKTISKADFLEAESLIDKIPFKEMEIPHREKFNESYCAFKECAVKIFLGEEL